MRRPSITLALLLLLITTSCSLPGLQATESPAPESPSPTGPPVYAGPEAPRLELSEVWRRELKGIDSVEKVTGIGSRLVLWGSSADDNDVIMIVDAKTGKPLWDDSDLPEKLTTEVGKVGPNGTDGWAADSGTWAVDDGRDGVLILDYHLSPCPGDAGLCPKSQTSKTAGHGVVAISLADRSVRWASAIIPSRDQDRERDEPHLAQQVIGASDSVIAAMTYQGTSPDKDAGLATIAVDPRTGERLWRTEGLLPSAVEGDRVLALDSPKETATGTPVVLDGRSGAEVIKLKDTDAVWSAVGDGLATISPTRGDEPWPVPVIEVADGRSVIELPRSGPRSVQLSRAAAGPVAWWYDDERLLTQAAGEPAPQQATPPDVDEDGGVRHATGDYAWVTTEAGLVALDRTGQARSDQLPGSIELIDQDLILVESPDDEHDFAVHRRN